MRHRLFVPSVLLAAASSISCGDDEPARRQAVFYLALTTTAGANCASADSFELPEGSGRVTATGMTGEGERAVDSGGTVVTCSVRPAPNAAGSYEVDLSIQTQDTEIGYFSARGVVSETASDLAVRLQTTTFQLEQQSGCTATVDTAISGAVWLRDLNCPQLRDERTIGNICTGRGALIFENCSR